MTRSRSRSRLYRLEGPLILNSFVAETLRGVGRDMRTKEVDEDHVEEHVRVHVSIKQA